MIFEDLEVIWRDEKQRPTRAIDDEALKRLVLERARSYRRKIFWRDASDIGVHLIVAVLLISVCVWGGLRDGRADLRDMAPLLLIAGGYTFAGLFRFFGRRRQTRREQGFDDSVRGNLRRLISNAGYQIELHSRFFWWYILPVVPGFVLLAASFRDEGPEAFWFMSITFCAIFWFIFWSNKHALRTEHIPQKAQMDALLAGLENGGQTLEMRAASTDSPKVPLIRRIIALALAAIIFALVGWFLAFVFLPADEPRAPDFDDVSSFERSDVEKIDAWLLEQIERCHFPSLSVAIVRDGELVHQRAFGFENTWTDRPASTNTAYHVASVTKAFTASLAMLLHDRGVLDLDQPVVSYLPAGVSISTTPELGSTITLRQLATHTSGLPRGVPGRVQSIQGRYELEPERLYKLLADVRLVFDPGTDDLYSNLGFGLLGHVLELAADAPLDRVLQELICGPLDLQHTVIHVDEDLPIATGYTTPPRLPESHSYRERLAGSGGLVTSAGDLAKFLAAHMRPGLFTGKMLERLHATTILADGSEIDRALGWSIDTNNPTGRILSKNGGRKNAGAWIGFAPDHGVGVAVITNVGAPDVDPIGRWLLERSIPGGSRPATSFGYAKVAPYSGVRWENDLPVVRVDERWYPLASIDGISIDRIMEFANEEFGGRARKRFAEDLPELLSTMGHEPGWKVILGLEVGDGQIEELEIRMTEENRSRVRE